MTETEQKILDSLLELERTIETMPNANPRPNLIPLFARVDELARTLPSTSEPLLLHYLHKKSYQKARLFLQGREAENARGNCHGHVDEHGEPWSPERPADAPLADDRGKVPPGR